MGERFLQLAFGRSQTAFSLMHTAIDGEQGVCWKVFFAVNRKNLYKNGRKFVLAEVSR